MTWGVSIYTVLACCMLLGLSLTAMPAYHGFRALPSAASPASPEPQEPLGFNMATKAGRETPNQTEMLLSDMRAQIAELQEQLRACRAQVPDVGFQSAPAVTAAQKTFILPQAVGKPPKIFFNVTQTQAFLRKFSAAPLSNPVRVCLVTSALAGPTLNGGIATAFYSMARHLAADPAFQVTVLYAAHPFYGSGKPAQWISTFTRFGIDFRPLPDELVDSSYFGAKYVVRSFRIFEYLRDHQAEFDVISYHDYMANGYFTALAKHQGLAFANTLLVVQCHSTSRWADILNYRPPKDHNTLGYYYMEQKSLEYADIRISPSLYYLHWMRDEGFYDLHTHGRNLVIQNLMFPLDPQQNIPLIKSVRCRHFVFFGRLEVRKGVLVFLDALDRLHAEAGSSQPTTISFLGPETKIGNERALTIIQTRSLGKPWKLVLETQFNTFQALKYIKEQGAVAVLPTLGDNSPYVLMELMLEGIPMITTEAGGGLELMKVTPGSANVVPPGDSVSLAKSMRTAMEVGISNVAMSVSPHETKATYMAVIRALPSYLQWQQQQPGLRQSQEARFTITMGVTSHNRPKLLLETIETIAMQNYPKELLHVVVGDDASEDPSINSTLNEVDRLLRSKGLSHDIFVNQQSQFVAKTRNLIMERAVQRGSDFVCFMDDDDRALPNMLSVYMQVAARTGADVLTDVSDNFDNKTGRLVFSHRSLAIGDAFAHNFFINNYGKANFCVKASKAYAIGGHQTGPQSISPYVDWGFFTRASLHNLKIELIPLPLYLYRKESKDSIWYDKRTNKDKYDGHGKILNDLFDTLPPKLHDVLHYCRYRLGIPTMVGNGLL